jgi:PAS domain S-box-containing protein
MSHQETARVLIAEDDYLVRQMIEGLMEEIGHTMVGAAADGLEAVEMTQSLRPDVVLMDIKMPEMDGLEATRRIHEACPTPVVMLTAYDTPEMLEEASAAGAGAYLVKPPLMRDMEKAITIAIARFDDMMQLRRLNAELRAEITERKRAEEALRESEEKYRLLVENATQIIVVAQDGMLQFFNPQAMEITGYSREELASRPFAELIHPDDLERTIAYYLGKLKGEETPEIYALRIIDKDGNVKWLESNAVLITWESRPATLNFLSDITERKQAEEALRESERNFRLVTETIQDVFWMSTPGITEMIYISPGYEEIWGKSMESLYESPRSFLEVLHPEDLEQYLGIVETFHARGKAYECEYRIVPAVGPVRWIQERGYPIADDRGNVILMTGICTDITERKRAEEEIRQRNEELIALNTVAATVSRSLNLQEVLDQALDKVLEVTGMETGSIYLLNQQAEELVLATYRGASKEFADTVRTFRMGESLVGRVGQSGEPIVVDDLAGDPRVTTSLVSEEGIHSFAAIPLKSKEKVQGVMNIASHQVHPFRPEEVRLYTAIANQIGVAIENARLYEQVQAGRQRLAQLARQIAFAQEEERRRLSRELHDELGQALTAISFELAAIEKELPPELAPTIKESLAEAKSLAAQADEQVSELALALRPYMLDDLGLIPTLRWYANRYTQRLKIEAEVEAIGLEERLPPQVETVLYRAVQEALTNVAKHAQASRVSIRLERKEAAVVALIEDDGRGFDVEKIADSRAPERGAGLLGMRERVTILGGSFHIQSHPGQGTRLTIEIPIN